MQSQVFQLETHKDRNVKGVKYITLDISNKDKFNKIKKYSFNYVINLAGYVDIKIRLMFIKVIISVQKI